MEMGKCLGKNIVCTAADVSAGSISFPVDSAQVTGAMAVLRDAAGALKAWDGAITTDGDTVTLDNSGAVDFADTDVFVVIVVSG